MKLIEIKFRTQLIFCILAAYGLWMLNDVVPNEDLIYLSYLERYDLSAIWRNAVYSNAHAGFFPYPLLILFGNPLLSARVYGMAMLFVIGFCIRKVALLTTNLNLSDCNFIALISVVWPGYMLFYSVSLFSYPFYLMWFAIGILLVIKSVNFNDSKYLIYRIIGLLLIFISFVVNSFLLVFYLLPILEYLAYIKFTKKESTFAEFLSYLKRNYYLFLLPLVYWSLKKVYAFTNITKNGYNDFKLSPNLAVENLILFLKSIILAAMPNNSIEIITLGVVILIGYLLMKKKSLEINVIYCRTLIYSVIFGILFLLLAITPYILVGKAPGPGGVDNSHWYTRHLLLAGIPVAIILVASVRIIENGIKKRVGTIILSGLIAMYIVDRIDHCVNYQLIGIQDVAFSRKIKEIPNSQNIYIWGVSSSIPGFGYMYKPDYVWPFFFQKIFGGERNRFMMEEPLNKTDEYYSNYTYSVDRINNIFKLWEDESLPGYSLIPINANPEQYSVQITSGISTSSSPYLESFKYWLLRNFKSSELNSFLEDAIELRYIKKITKN